MVVFLRGYLFQSPLLVLLPVYTLPARLSVPLGKDGAYSSQPLAQCLAQSKYSINIC